MFKVFRCDVVRTSCLARFQPPDHRRNLFDGKFVLQDGVSIAE